MPRSIITAIAIVLSILIAATFSNTFFKVDESEYVIVLRFGQIVDVHYYPGLGIKAPFVDSIQRIDKRTLRADIPPREVPDQDKERLVIDTVVRYKIVDPVAFRIALRNEATALDRIQEIIYSAMRDTIATKDRTEVIGARSVVDTEGNPVNNEEGLPLYEALTDTRDQITEEFRLRVQDAATTQRYGIEIISASIKRADFPQQVESAILDRLKAERQRVAAAHRARGEEEYRQRTAAVRAEADILIAEARRDARIIRGEGDAEAISIIQDALQRDPDFYRFLRKVESYENSITPGSLLLMSDHEDGYLDLLMSGPSSNGQSPVGQ